MRGSPVFIPNFIQICSYSIEKILENRQKRPNLGTPPVLSTVIQEIANKPCENIYLLLVMLKIDISKPKKQVRNKHN